MMDEEILLRSLFPHLIVGLAEYSDLRAGGNPGYPYPSSLRHAMNWLSVLMPLAGKAYPETFTELLACFEHPLEEWYPASLERSYLPDEGFWELPLLREGQLYSHILDFLAEENLEEVVGSPARKVQAALDQAPIVEIVNLARQSTDYASEYVIARRFIIEHPYATAKELDELRTRLSYAFFKEIGKVYEPEKVFRARAFRDGSYWACPYCHGILNWVGGEPSCIKPDICGRLRPDYTGRTRITAHSESLWRLKSSVHARTCIPGLPELDLLTEVEKLEAARPDLLDKPQLWPNGDIYDILICFKNNGQRWAIDVKDQGNPYRLGHEIVEQFPHKRIMQNDPAIGWDAFYYVVPDYRVEWDTDYCHKVSRVSRDVPIITVTELLREISKR